MRTVTAFAGPSLLSATDTSLRWIPGTNLQIHYNRIIFCFQCIFIRYFVQNFKVKLCEIRRISVRGFAGNQLRIDESTGYPYTLRHKDPQANAPKEKD